MSNLLLLRHRPLRCRQSGLDELLLEAEEVHLGGRRVQSRRGACRVIAGSTVTERNAAVTIEFPGRRGGRFLEKDDEGTQTILR